MGRTDEARRVVAEVEALAAQGTGMAVELACAHHALGDDTAAYAWLERGFENRELWMTWMHLDPRLRRLHGQPRFEELVKRVGVAPSARVTEGA